MQIQINCDHNIEGHEGLVTWATGEVNKTLGRYADHITRVEVHLSEEKGSKSAHAERRCMMEARLQGRTPLAVTQQADNLHQAVTGAADKLNRMIDSALGRAARSAPVPESEPKE